MMERQNKKEEMPYLVVAAQGKRPKTIPIVIELQSVTAPSNVRLREKYGFEEIMKKCRVERPVHSGSHKGGYDSMPQSTCRTFSSR